MKGGMQSAERGMTFGIVILIAALPSNEYN